MHLLHACTTALAVALALPDVVKTSLGICSVINTPASPPIICGCELEDHYVIPQLLCICGWDCGLIPLSVLLRWIWLLALGLPRGSVRERISSISPLTHHLHWSQTWYVLFLPEQVALSNVLSQLLLVLGSCIDAILTIVS